MTAVAEAILKHIEHLPEALQAEALEFDKLFMNILKLNLIRRAGKSAFKFEVRRIAGAGFVGRNREAVLAHIEELKMRGWLHHPLFPWSSLY